MQLTKDQINTIAEALRRQRNANRALETENIGHIVKEDRFRRLAEEAETLRAIFEDAESVDVTPSACPANNAGIKVLATIELDYPHNTRGELFYHDGYIHCRVIGSVEILPTGVSSTKETAKKAIFDTWGCSWRNLQWVENGGQG